MSALQPDRPNFVGVIAFEAIYRTAQETRILLLELRRTAAGGMMVLTEVNGQRVRVGSIHELILTNPACLSLTIPHRVRVVWNGASRPAELLEILAPSRSTASPVSVQLRLAVDTTTYETAPCDTLSEAMTELQEGAEREVDCSFQICHRCAFSWPFLLGPDGMIAMICNATEIIQMRSR